MSDTGNINLKEFQIETLPIQKHPRQSVTDTLCPTVFHAMFFLRDKTILGTFPMSLLTSSIL